MMVPFLEKAKAANDLKSFSAMVDLNHVFEEQVNQQFLLLRVSAVYFSWRTTDKTWDNFQKQVIKVQHGLELLNTQAKAYPAVVRALEPLKNLVSEYLKTGYGYHKYLQNQQAKNKDMLASAVAIQEVGSEMQQNQQAAMNKQIHSSNRLMIGATCGAIILGF